MLKKKIDKNVVIEFLKKNPDFFIENSNLLETLNFPNEIQSQTSEDVISFKDWIINKLKNRQIQIIKNVRYNFLTQNKVHEAILKTIEFNDLKLLISFVNKSLPNILDIDCILLLCSDKKIIDFGGYYIQSDKIKQVYGKNGYFIMDAVDDKLNLFKSLKYKIYSNAIFSLNKKIFNAPAILVFGSKEKMFLKNKGSELVLFFSKIFQQKCKSLVNGK